MSSLSSRYIFTVADTQASNESRKLLFVKNVSNHAISFALEKTTLRSRGDNTGGVLQKRVLVGTSETTTTSSKSPLFTWPRCCSKPKLSNRSGQAIPLGSARMTAEIPHMSVGEGSGSWVLEREGWKKFNARRRRLGVWSTTVACDLLSTGGDWTGCGAEQFVVILKLYWKGLELRRMKKFRSLNFGEKLDNSAWNADYSLSEYMTGWLPALIFVVKVTAASRVANIWMKHRCGWFLHLQIAVILDPRFRVASSQHLIAHE